MGSQTTGAGKTLVGKVITRILPLFIRMFGKTPGPFLNLGPEDEISGFLLQWSEWNRSGKWVGKDGFDYYYAMEAIHIPTLLIAGGNDFIAPPGGCRDIIDALGSAYKKFVLCSTSTGYSEDYTHPRLIASTNSRTEIWPMVLKFISRSALAAK